jgi:hypothetical protein
MELFETGGGIDHIAVWLASEYAGGGLRGSWEAQPLIAAKLREIMDGVAVIPATDGSEPTE